MALGSGEKVISKSEMACKRKLGKTVVCYHFLSIDLLISFISFNIGKTIVAKRKIAKGDVISYEDVVVKVNLSFVFPH